ncbi:MAG: bifunctional diaminohydroxyphosphoribosylaminopyrimidine deaminase/5-amino-6-(5-phosphoribosylamino)uracil reductase RibD [Candidatus Azobacteroides sp.]|nr:bifunctional diaminohydroxyphosphoribosylaminopyrimidine deaminase/5-amino-6-(5-phosphoribosylamino)uracil reductase RibD [Candidatus Azobacteroides sp.]
MDEKYMHRCIQLAQNGKGFVAPNPMVGAVIVHNDIIIGEGFHRQYGEAHAEVNAVACVKDQSLLEQSTMYVNLEPCSHYGKTPPCTGLIIDKKIPEVVIGCIDPFPEVSGRGIRILQEAGVEVTINVLKEECERLNRRFFTFVQKKRPYIILKWAQSADGFIDKKRNFGDGEKPVRLSNDFTQLYTHKTRAEESAILVGFNTALLDNPALTTRSWNGKNPLRIVLDKDLNIPANFNLLDGNIPTLIYTRKKKEPEKNITYREIEFNKNILPQIMADLYNRNIQSLIVEGGSMLLNSFIQSNLWDEAKVETTSILLNSGVPAPYLKGNLLNVLKCKKSVISQYENRQIP